MSAKDTKNEDDNSSTAVASDASADTNDTSDAANDTNDTDGAPETSSKQSEPLELPSFYGVKEGMTRIFDDKGNHIPVTVIRLIPNVVTQVKTMDNCGYEAYQVAYHEKREKLVSKPIKGHLAKAKVGGNFVRFSEVRVDGVEPGNLGREVSISAFTPTTVVDVTGTSKGKGFQGVIRRHNFSIGPKAHGSKFHRSGGSIGNRATPGRVWKNKKMPGHMGMETKTMQNLVVVEVNQEQGYMLIKGSVPGEKRSFVRVSRAVKSR